jgi:hypothetical protein
MDKRNRRLKSYRNILTRAPQLLHAWDCTSGQDCVRDDYEAVYLSVFAPTLTAFAEWVLAEARRSGKQRLYFLSRDGWLMYRAAQLLAGKKSMDIDLRYLKVSRFSLRSAEYHLMGEDMYDRICAGGIDITFDKVMRRANLSEAEASEIKRMVDHSFTTGILGYRKLQQLKQLLRDIPEFRSYVNRHSESCYSDTVGYLVQEGMGENIPYAVVDSGWIGTIQQSLEHLINKKIEGYYFGLYELPAGADPGRYRSYFFSPQFHICRKARFSNCLFEAVCSSPEGMVIGYRKKATSGKSNGEENIRYIPVESDAKNPNRERMERNRMLLERYLDNYPANQTFGKTPVRVIARLLGTLMARPCVFEAEAMGSLLFCDDVLEMQMQKVAADLSDEELRKHGFIRKILIKCGLRKETLHESGWLAASIVKNRRYVGKRLLAAESYQYLMYSRKALMGK